MLARVQSHLLQGIDALPCEVEIDVDESAFVDGNRAVVLVGLPDAGVREAHERVRTAMTNSGFVFPRGKVVVNLAPADVRKEGPVYDLPIAVGILAAMGVVGRRAAVRVGGGPEAGEGLDYRTLVIAGELALDGRVRPIRGALAMTAMAKARGARGVVVPVDNAPEAAVVQGIDVFGVATLAELVGLLTGTLDAQSFAPPDVGSLLRNAAAPIDFAEVRGQEGVKRALTIAAAGGHNLLRSGPSAPLGDRRRPKAVGHNLVVFGPTHRLGRGLTRLRAA
ncbi:MAG: hypothetical protein HBSAPP03_16030 [Phycisphaerae bacterium]|nr:MAG: hypothetical protein HBSAPP03_16030 [Phycisphaerae bacterium]